MFNFRCLFIMAVVSLILSSNVFAQEKMKALPDDPLYQAKREMETAQLNAKTDPLEKANLHTEHARERLAEIKAMISKGKPEFVEGLTNDYEKTIDEAMKEINKAQGTGRDVSKALRRVEQSTKKHTEVLTGLLQKVPEQAKPAILHAIEVSKKGRNRALDVLNKIQRGELPIGKPEDVGKPKEVSKPEGKGTPAGTPAGRSGGKGKGR